MAKQRQLGITILAVALIGLTVGCSQDQATEVQEVTFDQLCTNPDQYNSSYVTIEGFYFHGFEVIVLSDKLEYSGYAEGHLAPRGRMLWIEGEIPEEVHDQLYQQTMMGPEECYGKVRLKGKFEYGGKYGHAGGYSSQIIPSEIELLEWSPVPMQQ